jgi:hypothetical protein
VANIVRCAFNVTTAIGLDESLRRVLPNGTALPIDMRPKTAKWAPFYIACNSSSIVPSAHVSEHTRSTTLVKRGDIGLCPLPGISFRGSHISLSAVFRALAPRTKRELISYMSFD